MSDKLGYEVNKNSPFGWKGFNFVINFLYDMKISYRGILHFEN